MDQTDLYCQVTREKFLSQESLHREFGAKASNMLGFGTALIGVGAIILNLSGTEFNLGDRSLLTFFALIFTFLLTAIFSLIVLLGRTWGNGPTVESLASALNCDQDRDYAKLVGDGYKKSVNDNWRVLDSKACALKCGVVSLVLESIAVAVLGFLHMWSL